jgi:outer membrane protein
MIRPLSLAAALLALLAGPLQAAPEDLLDIYRQAQVEDRQLRAAAAELDAVREAIPQARAARLPQILLGGDITQNYQNRDGLGSDNFTSSRLGLSLAQSLFDRAAWLRQGQASKQVQQAEVSFTFEEQNLILRTAQTYFAVLNALADLDAVRADKEAIGRQLEQTKQRFEVGLIAITDVHEAQARYDRVLSDEILSRNAVDSARESLRVLTGNHHPELAGLADDVPLVEPQPARMEEWVVAAERDNLALLAARYGIDVAREEIEVRRAGHYPTVDLVAAYADSNTNSEFGSDLDAGSVGVELNLPLYTGGLVQSRTREAAARLVQASEQLEQTRRGVEQQTRDAYRSVIASIAVVEALQQAVVSTQSALDATEAGFEVGTRTVVDVLDAQRDLFQAQRDYSVARHAYIVSTLALKQAVGSLGVADLEQANRLLR